MTARYAIYFSPDDNSELGIYGATVLRRQAENASDWLNPALAVEYPDASGSPDSLDWAAQIKKPAHYGFHATIKAPFELAESQSSDELAEDLKRFCQSKTAITLVGLKPVRSCRYHSLAFDQQPSALPQLAAECVTHFEKYRAPLTNADIERRNPDSLKKSERENLHRYGYPYILEDFNFHMTLSGQNKGDDVAYFEWLCDLYQVMVEKPPVFDRLCVFRQPDRQSPFVREAEFFFGLT